MNLEELLREVERLRGRVTVIQASEARYRSLVELASEVICVTQEGLITFFNSAAQELTGYSEDELLKKPFSALTHPDDRQELAGKYRQRLRGEHVPPEHRFRIITSSKEIKWVESSSASIVWEGRPAVLSMIRDVTTHVRTEELLRQAREELYARVRERTAEREEAKEVF
ncbi:MAG: PAS domain S-box protein [Thermodesulfobacteriota bacterium]